MILDTPINPYVEDGTLISMPFEDPPDPEDDDRFVYADEEESARDWEEEIAVYVKEGLIASVSCSRRCELRGRNLIGLDYETVRKLVGSYLDADPDVVYLGEQDFIDEVEEQYYFEEVDANVWVEDGIVKSITCGRG